MDYITIRGAKTHNLKNINLQLPRNQMVVITGISGSGKTSIARDTLYAEGQRRYVESLSAYARQFLSVMEKPDVEHIEGLSPAISIEQKSTSHNPRSTVGTVTEIYDYLRLLFARVGKAKCPEHKTVLEAQTVSQIVDAIMQFQPNSQIMLLAPIIQDKKGEHSHLLKKLQADGYLRAKINGEIYELDDPPKLNLRQKHTISVIIDRLKVNPANQARLADSIESGLKLGHGIITVAHENKEQLFSAKLACHKCNYSIGEIEPRLFSFNNPTGACETCDGLGVKLFMDVDKIVYEPSLSINSGAIRMWDRNSFFYHNILTELSRKFKFSLDTPFEKLSKKIQQLLLYGNTEFEGIIPNMERRYHETESDFTREELAKFLTQKQCATCLGTRLNQAARNVYINDVILPDVVAMSIKEAKQFFIDLKLSGWRAEVADKILKEIIQRLDFLINVGLEYLTLNRTADTLSGGEAQRIRLASQIGSGLVGVMYILDEPTIGLHQRDNARLIKTLLNLKHLGNTVILVEHDEEVIRNADYIVDIGPGAGVHGGQVVAAGPVDAIIKNHASLTGRYLAHIEKIEIPRERIKPHEHYIEIIGASEHNLKNIDVSFPLGLMTCVTGVSGSGKSTLVNDILLPIAAQCLNGVKHIEVGKYKKISGLEHLDKVVDISQAPIGRTPRSNPATYTQLFAEIRELFSATQEARARGYKLGRFSFNVKGGRCEACAGDGLIKVAMHFLPDIYVPCDVCHGKRYNRETLEVYYKGKNIYEVLEMTVEDALQFFHAIPTIAKKLSTLVDVGLSYIKLGQSATTLSGGEAQRIKLAKELARRDTGKTLYILDEPTTGLHFHDVKRLLAVLNTLRDHGNTIIIIEHNLDVIKTADWIIDLGPEGGCGGGTVVASGTPEMVAQNKLSFTGQFLYDILFRK